MTGLLVDAVIVASLIVGLLLLAYKARHKHSDADRLKQRQDNDVPINRRAD